MSIDGWSLDHSGGHIIFGDSYWLMQWTDWNAVPADGLARLAYENRQGNLSLTVAEVRRFAAMYGTSVGTGTGGGGGGGGGDEEEEEEEEDWQPGFTLTQLGRAWAQIAPGQSWSDWVGRGLNAAVSEALSILIRQGMSIEEARRRIGLEVRKANEDVDDTEDQAKERINDAAERAKAGVELLTETAKVRLAQHLAAACEVVHGGIIRSEQRASTIIGEIVRIFVDGGVPIPGAPAGGGAIEGDLGATIETILETVGRIELGVNIDDESATSIGNRIATLLGFALRIPGSGEGIGPWLKRTFKGLLDWLGDWRRILKESLRVILAAVTDLRGILTNVVIEQANRVIGKLQDKIGDAQAAILGRLDDSVRRVLDKVGLEHTNTRNAVTRAQRAVESVIRADGAQTRREAGASEDRLTGHVTTEAKATRDRVAGAEDRLRGHITSEVESSRQFAAGAWDDLGAGITHDLDNLGTRLIESERTLWDKLTDAIRIDLSPVLGWIERLLGAERDEVAKVSAELRRTLDQERAAHEAQESATADLLPPLEKQATSLEEMADWIKRQSRPEEAEERRRKSDAVIEGLILGTWDHERPSERRIRAARRRLWEISTGTEACDTTNLRRAVWGKDYTSEEDAIEETNSLIVDALAGAYQFLNGLLQDLIKALASGAGGPLFNLLALAQIQSECVQLAYRHQVQYVPLSPADGLRLHRWGAIGDGAVRDVLRQHGFNENRREALIAANHVPVSPGAALDAWHRELVTEGYIDDLLKRAGLDATDAKVAKAASFYRAPPSDLILMAVRDVFDPAARRRLALDEDFPPAFEAAAKRIGITADLAKDYWAAHWSLPSAGQGYAMLHRGIIDDATLDDLLRAKDYAPIWRPRLKAIAYRTLNRVDVRRMFTVGTLDAAGVLKAYKDLGYDESNAKLMQDFTLRWAADRAPTEDEVTAQGLTRGLVLRLFGRGTVDREQAEALLVESGMDADVAALWIATAEIEEAARVEGERVDTILVRYREGIATERESQQDLAALNLTRAERSVVDERLDQIRLSRRRLPSRSDCDRMLKAGLIEREEYLETMNRIGYGTKWGYRFFELASGQETSAGGGALTQPDVIGGLAGA